MAYEIIKSISLKDNQVNITSYCNNIVPRIAEKWHCEPLTKVLQDEGREEVIKQILLEFWKGNFKGTSTIYGKSLLSFKPLNNYCFNNVGKVVGQKKYEWSDDIIKYSYKQLKADLFSHFINFRRLSSKKNLCIVKVQNSFIYKLTSRRAMTTFCKESAKKFTLAEAQNIKSRFSNHQIEIIAI